MADTSLTGIIADFSAVLTTQLTAGATTAVISTNLTKAGETVPDGYYAFDLSKNESVEEHIVATFTSSTKTLSNIKRVSRLTGAVSGTGVANTHAKTATVTMVAFVPLARITDRLDGTTGLENVIKYDDSAVQVPSADEDIPHKKYVDDQDALTLPLAGGTMSGDIVMDGNDIDMATGGRVLNLTDATDPQEPATLAQLTGSIAGAPPNASETVKGVVEEATQAEVNAGTDTGATGAKLFVPPSKLQTYVSTSIDENQRVLSQMLITDGLFYEWDGVSAYGVTEEKSFFPARHTKLYDSTNKILFLICPDTPSNNSIIIRSYKFNEYFQITHENRYDFNEAIDNNEGMGLDMYGGSLWFAFFDTQGDAWLAEYTVNTTTGELTFARNNQWADPVLANTGSTIVVDDTHINYFSLSNNVLRQVDRSDLSTNTATTFSVVEEDETTAITQREVIGFYQSIIRNGNYFYTARNTGLANDNQQGNGFEWDSATNKLIRRVSTGETLFDFSNGQDYNDAVIDTVDNRLISFLDTQGEYQNSRGGKVIKNMRMNVSNANTVTITTL